MATKDSRLIPCSSILQISSFKACDFSSARGLVHDPGAYNFRSAPDWLVGIDSNTQANILMIYVPMLVLQLVRPPYDLPVLILYLAAAAPDYLNNFISRTC